MIQLKPKAATDVVANPMPSARTCDAQLPQSHFPLSAFLILHSLSALSLLSALVCLWPSLRAAGCGLIWACASNPCVAASGAAAAAPFVRLLRRPFTIRSVGPPTEELSSAGGCCGATYGAVAIICSPMSAVGCTKALVYMIQGRWH
jgi:hypothetical protein